jgi:hypothetical protein
MPEKTLWHGFMKSAIQTTLWQKRGKVLLRIRRLKRLRKNSLASAAGSGKCYSFEPRRRLFALLLRVPVISLASRDTSTSAYTAGISFASRTRLTAVASRRNNQSTFLTPRTFTCRRMLSSFPQPNTFSTNLRFFWLMANPGSCLSCSVSQFGQSGLLSYSATRETPCDAVTAPRSALPERAYRLPG